MSALVHQRCFHHSQREAVARCPECRQFYCRECVTEHDDRVICANCLKQLTLRPETARGSFARLRPLLQLSAGLIVVWFFFYFLGASLLSIPPAYHEGTVWTDQWWKTE